MYFLYTFVDIIYLLNFSEAAAKNKILTIKNGICGTIGIIKPIIPNIKNNIEGITNNLFKLIASIFLLSKIY